ncbi:DUF4168 domain-containing protein [Phormidium pseudopriestleyi FRX01]|uniref:DUF4168 domain-containing protein n=1 Tax=Phormidium pseudopriestleyi FRX01 TaxID=1759528 RepID=A0ABS3FMW2_9CYAN|nr:DUF4168 domain-containing protein [Phormidium pseudopriestleyi]MBO0348373.1 DUF4168 domain-containing protein [Phormidium pseudopriestleyi FRX01]
MLKRLLTASSVVVLLLIGMTPAAIAQTQESLQQSPIEIMAQAQISNEDLDKFSRAIFQMLTIEQQFQERIVRTIEGQGFSQERFAEIYKATVQAEENPAAQADLNISPEEQEKFAQIMEEGKQIQEESQERQEQAIASLGLNMDRLNEIGSAIQQNPQLQQQVRTRLEQLMEQ